MRMCEALQELEQRGREDGIAQEKKAIIIRMLKEGMDRNLIKKITGADDALIDELA